MPRGAGRLAVVTERRVVTPEEPDRRRPRFIGTGHSGRDDLSERAEELLAASLDR